MSNMAEGSEQGRLKRRRTDEASHGSDDSDDAARAAAVLLDDEHEHEHDVASSTLTSAPARIASPASGSGLILNLVRDRQYYFEDGSIVLRVEDTLFKVHRTILSRDNSLFSAMFSLPQTPSSTEGLSDSSALLLPGEKAGEFKDFLWVLYALPHELRAVYAPGADLDRLINIAHKAAHYAFKSIETWILDAIEELVGRKPCPILAPLAPLTVSTTTTSTAPGHGLTTHNVGTSSSSNISIPAPSTPPSKDGIRQTGAQLTRLVRLAQTCGHTRLLDTLIKLLTGLMGLSLQFAYLAISLADELDLRALRGAAYLEIMSKDVYRAVPVSNNEEDDTAALRPGELDGSGKLLITRAQEHRLLAGYYRLTSAWERIRTKPPSFEHAPSCGATWHQHGCTQSWLEFWKDKSKADGVLALGLADACGRLKVIQKEFERWGSATYMHHDCRQAARRAIGERLRAIEGKLPDFFSDEGMVV